MELLAIKSDLAFRAVFGRECAKCKKALTALLNDILDLNITSLVYANPLNLQNFEGDKKSEMDIEVVTEDGERIDIEIQLWFIPGFANRVIYYGSKLVNESLGNGVDYEHMKKCKVLSILDFNFFPNNKRVQNRFRMKEVQDNFELSDVLEIIFLEMKKLEDDKPVKEKSPLERWLYFLKYANDESKEQQLQEILKESEGITVAMEVLQEVSADDQLRTKIRLQEKVENDWKNRILYAEREGEARGEARGERVKQLEIAKNLLDILDNETIAEKTGLKVAEVVALRQPIIK